MRTTSRISVFFLSLFVFSVGGLLFSSLGIAQQTRVAYIDAKKLLARMPEAKDAKARLDQLTSTWTKEATDMQAEIDRKQTEFDRRKLIMTDAERNTSELELNNLNKKHTDFIHSKFDGNGGDLYAQEAALMKPAYDKLSAAIKECATDGNYDYVIDRSSNDVVLLYTNSKFDLTLPVARKLGIESEIISTSLVNGSKPGTGTNGTGTNGTGTPGTGTPGQPQTPGQKPGAPGFPNPSNPQNPQNSLFPGTGNGNGLNPNNGSTPNNNNGLSPNNGFPPDTATKPVGH
jgi:Skp family chaperone for outer membrane proteins